MPYDIPTDYVLDQLFGYQSANKIKNSIKALAAARLEKSFGGSRENSVLFNGTFAVLEARDVEWDSLQLSGLTTRARVEGKTSDAATSVTPRIRNITDATDLITGTAITATVFTEQILAMALVAGLKKYRLQGVTNNGNNDVWLFGVSETYA